MPGDSSTRDLMIVKFNEVLGEALAKLPEAMFVNVPVGKLADAALELLADVPRVPAYDPEVTPQRRFHGVLTRDAATAGHVNDRAHAEPSDKDYGVVMEFLDGRTGKEGRVNLPPADAEQFFLNGLSIVAHQRAEERGEAAL